MNYYISDMHLSHPGILNLDKRPFSSIEEMNEKIVENWNARVNNNDNVYVLGDFCWGKEPEWIYYLSHLKGSITLIRGNHDLKQMSIKLKNLLADVKDYKAITDKGRSVIMSHYPIPFYKGAYNPNVYMLYGHVHTTIEHAFMEKLITDINKLDTRDRGKHKCNLYNCWCGFYNYIPATLDEIIEYWRITRDNYTPAGLDEIIEYWEDRRNYVDK